MKFITVEAARSMRCVHPGGAICAADGCMAWIEKPVAKPEEVQMEMPDESFSPMQTVAGFRRYLCDTAKSRSRIPPGWIPNENKVEYTQLPSGGWLVTIGIQQKPVGRCGWINAKEAA